MDKKRVLVFPCGSEIGLEINNALKYVKNFEIYGGSSVQDHGRYVYRNYIDGLPNVDDENFISEINSIIDKYSIDFIFPAHDSVVLKLSQYQESLHAIVITSEKETSEICRSKKKTYEFFKEENFIPYMYNSIEEVGEYPVFLKPNVGQGSKGTALVKNLEDLNYIYSKTDDLLILEYLPGDEYTIDCFTDRYGKLRFIGMRERRRVKSGISVNSVTLDCHSEVEKIAVKINEKLNFRGVWFFQVKKDINGTFKLLEISPRIAGTMGLYRNKGINLPLLSLFDRMEFDINIHENSFNIEIDRALINRFSIDKKYERVYLDFDDTVTLGNSINPFVMMFIYQCVSKEIEIVLITKHEKDINNTLQLLKVDKNLFSEILHINKDDEKYKYMNNEKAAIFIDDSYSERIKVSKMLGMPVFDIDAIESLIDWRN
ncbi:ATP-grasp domain-containing protein [Heyndrickxia camelliae]|uniref:Carbamoylphosphate synthase large subunit short form n=1 Tax=Heyndrickxia camelliae TaxID=1707093 RepID=A0A2N3LDG0_9BACI|nr:ATP-grasp domain-containing protein [Heyndrickxia camelliae]PKR82658.1 carbamoylphosphate synthase large subunit short form [Heyndrickxia camelliae]